MAFFVFFLALRTILSLRVDKSIEQKIIIPPKARLSEKVSVPIRIENTQAITALNGIITETVVVLIDFIAVVLSVQQSTSAISAMPKITGKDFSEK